MKVTLFTCPLPFEGHRGVIQRNAITSWTMQKPRPEIILIGEDRGTKEICEQLDLIHQPDVRRNEYNTPLVDSVFQNAEAIASNNILCYVNSDIILLSDFFKALNEVEKKMSDFFLIGGRWDINVDRLLDFNDYYEETLKKDVQNKGKLHAPTGKDYFVFKKGFYKIIPPFAIGRGMWDDWLVYYARKRKSAVIDITNSVTAIHQNHDYIHISMKSNDSFRNKETEINKVYAGKTIFGENRYSIDDANYMLTNNCIIRKSSIYIFYRFLYRFFSQIYMVIKNGV